MNLPIVTFAIVLQFIYYLLHFVCLADAQLEIYLEQIFIFQDILEDPGELTFPVRLCSYLLSDLRCSVS